MAVPYTFGSATTSIPLSQLDSNFATAITLGNTAVQLGNTITNLTGVTNLASSGALTLGSNGNTTAVTIDTSQNVGIGTASPAAKLDVRGSSTYLVNATNPTAWVSVDSALTTGSMYNQWNTTSSVGITGTYTNHPHTFVTNNNERMRIDSSGNVGIGTASPSNAKLNSIGADTAPQLNLYSNSSGSLGANFTYKTSSGDLYMATNGFNSSSAPQMVLSASGNLGVGTTSPANSSGGTCINVAGTYAIFTGTIPTAGNGTAWEGRLTGRSVSARYGQINLQTDSSSNGFIQFNTATAGSDVSERMRIDTSGGLILAGSTAQKATGTTWSNPSDQRLKDNIRDYAKGTTELMQVRVREWEYNGKGGTTQGMKGLGVIADEVMIVLPETVENYDAKLNVDDEETTAIKKFDATEITWLLVKTVQEQQVLITALTARITALEAK